MAQIVFAVRHILSIRYIAAAPFISSITWWQNLLFSKNASKKITIVQNISLLLHHFIKWNLLFTIFLIIRWQHLLHCKKLPKNQLMKNMWTSLLEFFYLSSAIYFLHYLMAKSIVFQEISEQPPTPLLLPPFHVLTTTQTKPTKKHLRAQLNWQNTTTSDIQICAAKLPNRQSAEIKILGTTSFTVDRRRNWTDLIFGEIRETNKLSCD